MDAHTPAAFQLPDVLDLKAAAPLASDLTALRGHDLEIDAGQVQRLGGQCLQVLISASITWKRDQAKLVVANPSPAFVEGLNLLGAADLLLPETAQ